MWDNIYYLATLSVDEAEWIKTTFGNECNIEYIPAKTIESTASTGQVYKMVVRGAHILITIPATHDNLLFFLLKFPRASLVEQTHNIGLTTLVDILVK